MRGRSRKLKINYRTTEETRRFAVAVLEGESIDDLDGGEDSTGDYRSLVHGAPPTVRGFSSQEEELDWLAERIRDLQKEGAELKDICAVARTNALVERYERGLRARGFACVRLSRKLADNRAQEGVRLATMHRIKGPEFRHVMLAAVNEGVIPLRQAIENSDDPTERRAGELTERALFHVAVTRAVNRVFISYFGPGSPFLGATR